MKTKFSPTVVGMFVIGAFALGMIALLSFGGVNLFSKPPRFSVYFDESIHGLDLGSPVKLRGVRVGRVVDLNVSYDAANSRSVVAVTCELNRNIITDGKGAQLDVSSRERLQQLVDQGLRAQLGVLGLATGLLFVELDFVDPKDVPPPVLDFQPKHVVVPAMTSAISEFQASLSVILSDLKRVNFAGLSAELRGLLVDTRRQVNGVDLRGAVDQWARTGAAVEALANTPEIKRTFVNLDAALVELRATLGRVDTQVTANGTELQATLVEAQRTLESFNAAAAGAHRFISAQSGLGEEAGRALSELAAAAAAVQRLADFLERNPQALISGKQRPH